MFRDKKRYGQDPAVVVRSATATFNAPLKWKEPARVFTCSWSDFFIEQADEWRDEAWRIINDTPHLTYQILTKRPERIAACLPKNWPHDSGYPNVWLGVSGENNDLFVKRWQILREIPAAKRFLSLEPLLESVESGLQSELWEYCSEFVWPDWVIAGGETGGPSEVRPTDNQWLREIRDHCKRAGIAFFLKQITSGGYPIPFDRWPDDLKIREFPT
jgi:protein gp37